MQDLLHTKFQIAGRVIDPIAGTVRYAGAINKIPPRAVRVLCMLAEHPNQVVHRNTLVSEIWGDNYLVGQKAISQAIWQLRKALSADEDLIQTQPRQGYSLLVEPVLHTERSRARPAITAMALSLVAIVALVVINSSTLTDIEPDSDAITDPANVETASGLLQSEEGQDSKQGDVVSIGFPIRTLREVDGLGAVLSPDGSKIVYQREVDGYFDLVLFDTETGNGRNLTSTAMSSEWWPVFSPDGSQLTYWLRSESSCELVIRTLATSAIEHVAGDCPPLSSGAVSFSPDASALYITRPTLEPRQTAIFRHDLATGREAQLSFPTDARYSDSRAVVSPDGSQLALIRSSAEGSSLLPLIDLAYGTERIVSPPGLQPRDLAWSSDGSQLFTTASWQSTRQLVSIDVKTGGVTGYSLSNVSTIDARADLVLTQDKSTQNQLWTASLDNQSQLRMISAIGHSPRTPEFYHSKLIFSASHESGAAIWQTSKSAAIRQVAAVRSGAFWGPRVSPTLGMIAALWANQHAMSGVLINERTGNIAWLTLGEHTRLIDIDWSADGRTLYFVASQGDDWELWQRQLSSVKAPIRVSSDGVRDIEVSRHDGSLYALKAEGFFRIDVGGEQRIEFTEQPWPGLWTPVHDGIVAFRRTNFATPFELWRYGFDGTSSLVTTLPSGITPLQSISYDPRQNRIVFATASITSQSLQLYSQASLPVQPNIAPVVVDNPIPMRSQDCVSELWQPSGSSAPLCVDQANMISSR